ncbi:MAG: hypothetical protein NTV01_09565 [Bacteroidia bacterium]|nr:hypothetical protein [Bacteroidia bacterium]
MKDQIRDLFLKKPEYLISVPIITEVYENIKKEIFDQFFKLFERALNNSESNFEIPIEEPGYKIQLHIGEGESGVYFAYRLINSDNSFRYNVDIRSKKDNIKDKVVQQSTKVDLFNKYKDILCKLIDGSKSSPYSICYYNPSEFKDNKKLSQIGEHKYISLLNKEIFNAFIESLLKEELNNFEKIKEAVLKI